MKYLLLWLPFLFIIEGYAQTPVEWSQLSQVHYVSMVDIRNGNFIDRPRFSKEIKQLKGESIQIQGYLIPLDVEGNAYALSRYPYSACFFCGGAGPESVMDVHFTEPYKSRDLNEMVTLQGTLELNDEGYGLIYLLSKAKMSK